MCCEGSGEQTYHRIAQDWRRYSDQYKMQREAGHRYSYCAADVEVVTCVGVGAGVEARLQVTLRKGPWVRTGMWGICPQGRCDSRRQQRPTHSRRPEKECHNRWPWTSSSLQSRPRSRKATRHGATALATALTSTTPSGHYTMAQSEYGPDIRQPQAIKLTGALGRRVQMQHLLLRHNREQVSIAPRAQRAPETAHPSTPRRGQGPRYTGGGYARISK